MIERLDKYLVEAGIESRSKVKDLIKKGRISVNGTNKLKPELKIDTNKDTITFDGKRILVNEFEYFMLNKPSGIISSSNDKKQKTVVDLITTKTRKDLFPVGRLDKDTHGLIIISNDGDLAHKLLSPKRHVAKTYFLKARGKINNSVIKKFDEGIWLNDFKTMPAALQILKYTNEEINYIDENSRENLTYKGDVTYCNITIKEGKYHQIKRMFKAINSEVLYLQRISMGNLKLDTSLKEGEFRELTALELDDLKHLIE